MVVANTWPLEPATRANYAHEAGTNQGSSTHAGDEEDDFNTLPWFLFGLI